MLMVQVSWLSSDSKPHSSHVQWNEEYARFATECAKIVAARSAGHRSELVFALIEGKKADNCVFTRADGHAVKDFRKVWANVCERTGVLELLLDDLPRSAVRNMVRRNQR
jgi:hypothetical protein